MKSTNSSKFTYIDLFAGIGGFRLALDAAGAKCLNFSEINKDAIDTYCLNFNENPAENLGDIRQIKSMTAPDLLTAGVPCQSWSIAGRNLGFDDDRGQLWNDTLFLLNQSSPKAFIFENVKGLADPRNQIALTHILSRIREAGYHAGYFILNSSDYGIPQDRVRVYIVGFQSENHFRKFRIASPGKISMQLSEVIGTQVSPSSRQEPDIATDLFGHPFNPTRRNRKTQGMNDYFLFNDIRNGPTTIHSWDLLPTSDRQKAICLLMLKNRRKETYGNLDGNPLSLSQLNGLDSSITSAELASLVLMGILKTVPYSFSINHTDLVALDQSEQLVLRESVGNVVTLDAMRSCKQLVRSRGVIDKAITAMLARGILTCTEIRYEFKYTKISTGIDGINRVFLPRSEVFPTLVASDTNDFVALKDVDADSDEAYKQAFLTEIFEKKLFRKISKEEACIIQGFPKDFQLPESRARWMKLIGNSVSVPVISSLVNSIVATGCFEQSPVFAESLAA